MDFTHTASSHSATTRNGEYILDRHKERFFEVTFAGWSALFCDLYRIGKTYEGGHQAIGRRLV